MIAPQPALEPTERIAAIVTGWAAAWALMKFGMPDTPALIIGLILFAYACGRYRSRWVTPPPEAKPEPGS